MKEGLRKFLTISLPAVVVALIVMAGVLEVAIRATWDEKKGRPGFFISSDTRLEKLAPNYSGWYAGVPVRINNLGFRDSRDYDLAKQPHTFRILVLGDSVTFGHGAVYETTYPYLLESQLRQWKPEIDWQVWNLGVPGYNSAQELAYLNEVGPSFQPDLVIVGFFVNDVFDNFPPRRLSGVERAWSRLRGTLSGNSYSFHVYKKAFLGLSSWLFSAESGVLSANLTAEESLLKMTDELENLAQQQIVPVTAVEGWDTKDPECVLPESSLLVETILGQAAWREAMQGFVRLREERGDHIVFFNNAAPDVCVKEDRFVAGPSRRMNDYFVDFLSKVGPVVSSYDAFLPYRPSQMPLAGGHSLGNANVVKSETLFRFLTTEKLLERHADSR
jgi:hypothetical protein